MSLSAAFNAVAAPLSEAEQALKEWGIAYEKRPDGTLVVPGDIKINGKGLTRLPDLTRVVVNGKFDCSANQLTSLAGAPAFVGGDFWCSYNELISLAGAPASVGNNFMCHGNGLTSLVGAPSTVARGFFCDNNPLVSLEGAPQKFEKIYSDFGEFDSWDAVPYELQYSPETRARMEEEKKRQQEQQEEARIASYTLLEALVVPRPVTVIKRGRQS